MSLVSFPVPEWSGELPADVRALITDADRRIEVFRASEVGREMPAFVPCDFPRVYRVLRTLAERDAAPGNFFCEWGSGFGVVACLAAKLGLRAHGIEFEEALVREARELAGDHGVEVEFVRGTFVPPGGEELFDELEEPSFVSEGGSCGHELLGVDVDELDLVFAFPWPDDLPAMQGLFDGHAEEDSLLVTDRGLEGVIVERKVAAIEAAATAGREDEVGAELEGLA